MKLEGWDQVELAERPGDHELAEACIRALSPPGDIVARVDVIGQVLELTFT